MCINKAWSRCQSAQACAGLKRVAEDWKTLSSLELVPVCTLVLCGLSITVSLHTTI